MGSTLTLTLTVTLTLKPNPNLGGVGVGRLLVGVGERAHQARLLLLEALDPLVALLQVDHLMEHAVEKGLEALRVAVGRELEAGCRRAEGDRRAGDVRVEGDGTQLLTHAELEHLR